MGNNESNPTKVDLKNRVLELETEMNNRQAEHDEFSMEMALTISEFFQVMQKLTKGDFSVRAPENSPNELLSSFGNIINETIKQLDTDTQELETANVKMKEHSQELERSLEVIKRQQTAIAEMDTPIIQIWDQVLCLPIVGIVDSRRSAEMMENLLNNISETECRCVIVDITGVEVVDTQTADHFIKMIRAAGLLGAKCVITGIRPQIAQTLTNIGVDLSGIQTFRNLQAGLADSFKSLKLKVIDDDKSD
jgi:rsbT co-antagonist protein RsbR